MHVDYAFLCDAATEHGGKLNALGIGIDRLAAVELPATHPRLTFVARLAFGAEDAGSRRFSVRVVDADGRAVASPMEGEMHVTLAPQDRATAVNLLVELLNLEFTNLGPHEVSLAVDGAELVSLPLEVTRPA